MSDDSGGSDRGPFARMNALSQVLIAIAAIASALNVYMSFREEQAAKPKVILVQSLPHLVPIGRSGDNYEVKMTVLNAGDKVVHGCLAFVQDVDDEFMPHRYLPLILETEPGWSVSPGKAHTSKRRLAFKAADYRQEHIFIELWFQCVTDRANTSSFFYRVDLKGHSTAYVERWRDDPFPERGRPVPQLLKDQHPSPCPDGRSRDCSLEPPHS
jgi:hypothetical protein